MKRVFEEFSPQEGEAPAASGSVPDWLASLGEEDSDDLSQSSETATNLVKARTPDWLSALGEESSAEDGSAVKMNPLLALNLMKHRNRP